MPDESKRLGDTFGGALASAGKYFSQRKSGADPTVSKMEEAAGIAETGTVGRERTYKNDSGLDQAVNK